MRKVRLAVMLLCAMLLVACVSKGERTVRSLERFATELQRESKNYTQEDWEKALQEYEEIVTQLDTQSLTDAQLQEIGRIKGRCAALFARHALQISSGVFEDAVIEVEGVLKGLMEGFSGVEEEE